MTWNFDGYGKHLCESNKPKCGDTEAIVWGIVLAFVAVALGVLAIVVFTP